MDSIITVICNIQISQHYSYISRAFCNPSLFSDKIAVSSAYNIVNNLWYKCSSPRVYLLYFLMASPLIDKNSLQDHIRRSEREKGASFTLTYTSKTGEKPPDSRYTELEVKRNRTWFYSEIVTDIFITRNSEFKDTL